jgi:AraC-like DNA-binding protein
MKTTKEKILNSLNLVLNQEIKKTLLVPASAETAPIHGIPRLVINVKGTSTAMFYKNGELKTIDFPEKAWFYCSANGYFFCNSVRSLEGNSVRALEGVSLSFYGNYIRAMHISYDGITPPPTERDIFYHANNSISRAGQQVIHALDELALSSNYTETAPYLMKALLKISIEDIKKSSNNSAKFNANDMWVAINTYLRAHHTEAINRESVAQHFKLSPGYVSHLFQSFSHNNFSNTLLILRLDHAATLLKSSYLTIDEISFESGFNYTSYFIKRFKKHYGMTPHAYRKTQRKNT